MSSREKHRTGSEFAEDNYEATVLDFLNKEIAAVQPARGQTDQSAELDALVSDLLKQVMTESDQHQPGQTELPGDRESLISGMMPDTEEASPADSNLLVNLNRGLSQSLTESDIWDSQGTEPPMAATQRSGGDSLPLSEESPALPPQVLHDTGPDRASVDLSPKKAGNKPHAPVRERENVFMPALAPKRKVPLAAVAAVAVILFAGGAAYYFSSFSGGEVKNSSLPVDNSAPAAAADLNNAVPESGQAAVKPAKPQKAPPSRNSMPAGARAPAAERQPVPGKEVPTPLPQQPANDAKANPPAPVWNGNTGEAKPALAERAAVDRPSAFQMPAQAAASESSQSFERNQSSATAASLLPSGSADKPPALNPGPAKAEALAPIPQSLPALPSQARALVPAVPISQASPSFPETAVRMRTSGTVVLELQIDEKGKVVKATPVSGPSIFHYPAVNAALKWRYKPATINGANVPSQARVTMNFNLNK